MKRLADIIKREYKLLFAEALADAIDNTDFDLESGFFNTQMMALASFSDSDMVELRDLNIRTILSEALPKNVNFRDLEYSAWVEDVTAFCFLNISHPSFSQLLSVDKNYQIILSGMTEISDNSTKIIEIVRRDARIETKRRFYNTISDDLLSSFATLVNEAHVPALRALADYLLRRNAKGAIVPSVRISKLGKNVTSSRSYKDRKGSIRFGVFNGLLEIKGGKDSSGKNVNPYRAMMRRALTMLSSNDVLRRIDNHDRILANYIREYNETFEKEESDDNPIIMYAVGEDVLRQIQVNVDRTTDDRIDPDLVGFIQTFVVANAAYVQGYTVVKTLMDDIDRSRRSFVAIRESGVGAEWQVLSALVQTQRLFSDNTSAVISHVSTAIESKGPSASVGLVSLGLGTMRGSLQAMAAALLDGAFGEAKDIARGAGRAVFRESVNCTIESENLQQVIVAFISGHEQEIAWLAENLPVYFSWLKSFADLVKLLN